MFFTRGPASNPSLGGEAYGLLGVDVDRLHSLLCRRKDVGLRVLVVTAPLRTAAVGLAETQGSKPMSTYADRLKALREQLKTENLDGFVVPLTDEHMSEYVGSYAQRLAWLTGFEGSAGSAVVLPEEAAIFVDGRYTLQVRQQVSPTEWSYQSVPETSTTEWLEDHAPEGARIGYDPWLHTGDWVKKAKVALASRGALLVPVERNPIDEIWSDRPEASKAHLVVQRDEHAGKSAAEKRTEIGDWLAKHHADAAVLSALDSIAWAFNIRGEDVTHTPVALAYALVHADGTADLFVANEKIGPEVRQHLGNGVRLHERFEFKNALAGMKDKTVVVDPERAVAAIFEALEQAGAKVIPLRDPTILPKAIKNEAEIKGHKAAQTRDGAAIAKFLHWIDEEAPKGEVDELKASDHLEALRRENTELRDLSFDSISGAGPNGAIVHYRSSEKTNRKLEKGTLYLIDSGGQYVDGTTDITRTVAIGEPTEEMRDRFTRVLKRPYRDRDRSLPERDPRQPARQLRAATAVGSGTRLCAWHRPRRRKLSCRFTRGRNAFRRSEAVRAEVTSPSRLE